MSDGDDLLRRLLSADPASPRLLTVAPDGVMEDRPPDAGAVLSGSFNPLHAGHERLAGVASAMLGVEVAYELSVVNVDKPVLEEGEVRRRLEQFRGGRAVVLTRAPTFVEKARLLPGRTFVIGFDTAVRLIHPRYYGDDEGAMRAALVEMRELGCPLLVAGRLHQGSFRTLADIAVPGEFCDLFTAIPEDRFRVDTSSTNLRDAPVTE